jgi:hypothetical protein
MSPLCAQKRTSLKSKLFGPVSSAERRLTAQPSTRLEQTAARAIGPAAMAQSPERRPLDIVQAGLWTWRGCEAKEESEIVLEGRQRVNPRECCLHREVMQERCCQHLLCCRR